MADYTYEDYMQRLGMQEVLRDAGYVRNRRDGMRYPSYVRLDNEGRRIRGDKFIVTQNDQCCFHPPIQKSYNIISFIKEHPDYFRDYTPSMNTDLLVNKVCCRLLNTTYDEKERKVLEPAKEARPFRLDEYELTIYDPKDWDGIKAFYPYFKHRGIDIRTQTAFKHSFVLAEKTTEKGLTFRNLSFPLTIPGKDGTIVGFEERGRMKRNGEKPYKGKAEGSNASEGLWMASPAGTQLGKAERVILFESAYDAMAYYQLKHKDDKGIKDAVFASTGGTPTVKQMKGLITASPAAAFRLCFDNDDAGRQFTDNFIRIAKTENADLRYEREIPREGFKDWNDQLLDETGEEETVKKAVGADIDGDGDVEVEESNEEKHHYHR